MTAQHRKAHVLLFVLAAVTKVATSATLQQASATTTTFSRSKNSSSRQYPRCGSSSSALASVFRLRGADEPQYSPRPTTFLGQLRDRFTSASSSKVNSVVLDCPSSRNSGVAALLHQAARAVKGRLMHSGAGVCGRGWLALVAAACILSVVRATASSAVGSRPWVWGRRSSGSSGHNLAVLVTDTDVAEGDEHEGLSSTPAKSRMLSSWRERRASRKGRMGNNDGERRRRLLMTPRFPLAYMPWWKALQDRRKVCVES